jgi:aminoglycoside 3-N-acetyltransferase
MLGYREIVSSLKNLGTSHQYPVLAHIHPGILKEIKGGAKTLLGALLSATDNLMLPSFTYRTQVMPASGPTDNAMEYGGHDEANFQAAIFSNDLPADEPFFEMAEEFRLYPLVKRSAHPMLSFVALGLNSALASQEPHCPYSPIQALHEMDAMVLLFGNDQACNFSLHYAEHLAGRKQFTRWGLSKDGILECTPFPGCPDGFVKINHQIENYRVVGDVAGYKLQAYSLQQIIETAVNLIKQDPFSLLCNRLKCERCNAVRQSIQRRG